MPANAGAVPAVPVPGLVLDLGLVASPPCGMPCAPTTAAGPMPAVCGESARVSGARPASARTGVDRAGAESAGVESVDVRESVALPAKADESPMDGSGIGSGVVAAVDGCAVTSTG